MSANADHYDVYYADRLWNLLPALYRSQDSTGSGPDGPLRELINRIGAQAAVLRRGIDRLWEDQSIETCDDWVVPYLADLLATQLVASLDSRGQRLEVARTLSYRRRKGTLVVLEQIAHDMVGWEVKGVEFFRRLGRTRHTLDPALLPALPGSGRSALQQVEQRVGAVTRTPAGGVANLRHRAGARLNGTAFDEYAHVADLRAPAGNSGWYGIGRVGVFIWRLTSYATQATTPVAASGDSGQFSFDPSGRAIPLFAAPRQDADFGPEWTSPTADQLPGPIGQAAWAADLRGAGALYGHSLAVFAAADGQAVALVPASQLQIDPVAGRFSLDPASPPPGAPLVTYHYGFSTGIGAGPYDRSLDAPALAAPESVLQAGGHAPVLDLGDGDLADVTLRVDDSLTYANPAALDISGTVCLQAGALQRPLLRSSVPDAAWILTGHDEACLILDGLWLCGADLVLAGRFASVTLNCCTLDPGNAGADSGTGVAFATAVDGQALVPTRLRVEGSVARLVLTRCIAGPVVTRGAGSIGTLSISDSIVQALPAQGSGSPPISPPGFEAPDGRALALPGSAVTLSRCTVLGTVAVQTLDASECLLTGVAEAANTQAGCLRYSAWCNGSRLPRQFRSMTIAGPAGLFTSQDFGAPGYCQLAPTADSAIVPAGPAAAIRASLSAGAEDGSEIGAFARARNPLKQRALRIKYQEFMPAGLAPVLINVT